MQNVIIVSVINTERSCCLSTLTKALIVLLTLSSIFLCGIVVTYVASANNYKQKYEDQVKEVQAAKSLYQTKMNLADEKMAEAQRKLDEAEQKITELEAQKAQIQVDLDDRQAKQLRLSGTAYQYGRRGERT